MSEEGAPKTTENLFISISQQILKSWFAARNVSKIVSKYDFSIFQGDSKVSVHENTKLENSFGFESEYFAFK